MDAWCTLGENKGSRSVYVFKWFFPESTESVTGKSDSGESILQSSYLHKHCSQGMSIWRGQVPGAAACLPTALWARFRSGTLTDFLPSALPTSPRVTDSSLVLQQNCCVPHVGLNLGLWWFILCVSLAGLQYPDIWSNIILDVSLKVFFLVL